MSGKRNAINRRQFVAAAGVAALGSNLMAVGCGEADMPKAPAGDGRPSLGIGASLGGRRIFPADNAWNQDISKEPVDPNSDTLIADIGRDKSLHPDFGTAYDGAPLGIPYVVVSGKQPQVPIRFTADGDESDPGPYPIPPDAPIEGGPNSKDDRHVVVLDRDNWKLYELI